jgi:hypothetical protein
LLWKGTREIGSAVIVFFLTTAVLSTIVIGVETRFGGEHGSVIERISYVNELQKDLLGIIKKQLDQIAGNTTQILEAQKAEAARAVARHNELKQLFSEERFQALSEELGVKGCADELFQNPRTETSPTHRSRQHAARYRQALQRTPRQADCHEFGR